MAVESTIKQASMPALDHTARYLRIAAESLRREHRETAVLFLAFRELVDIERDARIAQEAQSKHRRRADHDRG